MGKKTELVRVVDQTMEDGRREIMVAIIPPDGFTFANAELELSVSAHGRGIIKSFLTRKT